MIAPDLDCVPADFGELHFGGAKLGDRRRTDRLVRAANLIARRPDDTLPHKLQTPADLEAFYRLMNRPETTHAAVLAPHRERTLDRMRQLAGVVLIVHDGTELDYTGKRSLTGLGQLGNGSRRGYLCHNSLAIDGSRREVLGLVNQILHRRVKVPPGETQAQRRGRADRESRLWGTAATAIGPPPPDATWLHVADRGGDTFESLEQFHRLGGLVVRSNSCRTVHVGHTEAGDLVPLHDHARGLPVIASKSVDVSYRPADHKGRTRRPAQPKRLTTVHVAAGPVLVLPPTKRRGDHGDEPIPLWVVRVWEPNPPADAEPLEWFLLTDQPVTTAAQALQVVDWYEQRWIVEEFHKAQKTGCRIENPQFTSEAALQPTIAVLSVVAVFLLSLRELARRPDAKQRPATEVVDAETVDLLCRWRHGDAKPAWSIHDFVMALARLGGHQNRRSDGLPGWLTLWRGWQDLQTMLLGQRLAKNRSRCGVS